MDETTYDEQFDQLDPELRARVEAWRAAQTEPAPEDDEADLAELMEEPAGGPQHGRKAPEGAFGYRGDGSMRVEGASFDTGIADDGLSFRSRLRRTELGNTDAQRFRHGGDVQGWHLAWREPTGFPTGRPRAVGSEATTPAALAAVRRLVGWDFDDFERVAGGSRRQRDADERLRLARDVARIAARARGGGAVKLLALAYRCHPKTIQRLCREARAAGQST